jgi:hypothetical protein
VMNCGKLRCLGSTPPGLCALDFPAWSHIRFLHNHHLLQLTRKPPWLTIDGGRQAHSLISRTIVDLANDSQRYVQRILSRLPPGRLHLSTAVSSVTTRLGSAGKYLVQLKTEGGQKMEFEDRALLMSWNARYCKASVGLRTRWWFTRIPTYVQDAPSLFPRSLRHSSWIAYAVKKNGLVLLELS